MVDQSAFRKLNDRLDTWEASLQDTIAENKRNLQGFFNLTNSKDLFLKDVAKEFQEMMRFCPQAEERKLERLFTQLESRGNRLVEAAERAERMELKMMQQKEEYEQLLSKERKIYANVISKLLLKNARLQGKDDLGSRLMEMVSQREDEIKQKYSLPFHETSGSMFNITGTQSIDNTTSRLN